MKKKEGHMCKRGTAPQNITVILPAYNEEVSIGSIVLLARFYADTVIVVDDGSSDRTAELARRAGAEVVIHEINKGKGRALKTGFAATEGADIIVTMDSDGQHNPADIPKLVEPILKGEADMVNGSRYLNGFNRATPVYLRVGQALLGRFANMNSSLEITDSQSSFRAFTASTKEIFRFAAQDMAIGSEMLVDAHRHGLRIKEVEIGVCYGINHPTPNPFKHFAETFMEFIGDIKANRPLYYYSVPGFALTTISLCSGVKLLESFFLNVESVSFVSVSLAIFFTILGLFMTIVGIVMHSMSGFIRKTKYSQ